MKNLNLFCPINGTGYGITSLNILKSLVSDNTQVALFPIGNQIQLNSENDREFVEKSLENNVNYDPKAPCLKIWHQHDLAAKIGNGHYYVMPFFEIDKLNKREVHGINSADYVFQPSEWGKKILEENGVTKPIFIAPLGVDHTIFSNKPNKIRMEKPNYVFFHIGKWEKRKSQDVLIQAFNQAFEKSDNVELRLVPHNPFLKEEEHMEWINLAKNSKLGDKINIYNRLATQYHLADFIDDADCGVFVSRAEGWNNEIPESMAMNKPIIATNYSAHTQYCDDENSFLVNIDETEPAIDGKWFNGQGNWAKIGENQIEQIVEHMRYVYKNNIKDNPCGVKTANKYSWTNTAACINKTLTSRKSYANTKPKAKRSNRKVSK